MVLIGMNFCISRNIFKFVETIVNYVSEFSSVTWTFHLKGEEVFGFINDSINCSPRADDESHRPNHVNFS